MIPNKYPQVIETPCASGKLPSVWHSYNWHLITRDVGQFTSSIIASSKSQH